MFKALSDWGQPSGISQSEYNEFQKQKFIFEHGNRIKDLKFEIEYQPTNENNLKNRYIEERDVKRDKTRVAFPKIVFERF